MKYTPPQLSELLLNATAQKLDEACTKESDENRKLAGLLKAVASLVEAQVQADGSNQDAARDSLLGAYLYILETIRSKYYLHSPESKTGILYNSGSPLYSHLNRILNSITAREKLIYINKFHHFVEKNKPAIDQAQNIKSDQLLPAVRSVLTNQLAELTNRIAKIVNAVPTELSVTKHMEQLPDSYIQAKAEANRRAWFYTSKPNPKRIVLTQLAKAISTVTCEDESNLPPDTFLRSQRIKIGFLLFIEKKIADEYRFTKYVGWNPKNSALYRECRKILNIPEEYNLDDTQQMACLDSFNSYINDHEAKKFIEAFGRDQFGQNNLLVDIDTRLGKISKFIMLIKSSLESSLAKEWPATVTCATVGAILCSSPGYGVGQVYGLAIAEGRNIRPASDVIGNGITAYFGHSSSMGRFAFTLGDFIIASTITRAFAKVFELIGMAAGGIAGGAIGFTFDLTYKGLHEVCTRYLNYYDHHPEQMRNADRDLVQCLLDLPPEIFTPDKQNQIRYTAGNEEQEQVARLNR